MSRPRESKMQTGVEEIHPNEDAMLALARSLWNLAELLEADDRIEVQLQLVKMAHTLSTLGFALDINYCDFWELVEVRIGPSF